MIRAHAGREGELQLGGLGDEVLGEVGGVEGRGDQDVGVGELFLEDGAVWGVIQDGVE